MSFRVCIEPHNPEWVQAYAEEAHGISQALGPTLVASHHIGSTAIPGIYAKPILDFLIEVKDLAGVDEKTPAMEALGYEAMGEFGISGRRYFRKNNAGGDRTHHVHIFEALTDGVHRHLAFRDFMRAHPAFAQAYSDLKQKLARAHPHDIGKYMAGKNDFIKDMEQRALRWKSQGN